MVLPVDPAPGFGGLLLGAIVAEHLYGVEDDLIGDVHRLIDEIGFIEEAILRAVEKSSTFELINDQVLSVHNTQRAYVSVVNQKAYIQDFYDTTDLEFVLLVGDAAQVATPTASGGASDPSYAKVAGAD